METTAELDFKCKYYAHPASRYSIFSNCLHTSSILLKIKNCLQWPAVNTWGGLNYIIPLLNLLGLFVPII